MEIKKPKWLFTTTITTAITVLSLIPIPEVPELQNVPFFDKWVHFVMYGAMACVMWWESNSRKLKVHLTSFLFSSLWGGLMELGQAYLTTCRSGDWVDFFADVFGAMLGVLLSISVWKIAERILAAR